jgi:hypothetical protein
VPWRDDLTNLRDHPSAPIAARAADIYGRVAQEMAAQDAALDHLKGATNA